MLGRKQKNGVVCGGGGAVRGVSKAALRTYLGSPSERVSLVMGKRERIITEGKTLRG